MYQCWFQVLGVPQVKFKTGPCTWKARRDQSNRQATPDWSMASITSWGTDILSLSWVAARWDISTHPPQNFKSLYRGPNGIQSRTKSRWCQHLTLQGCVLGTVPSVGGLKVHSKDRGGTNEPDWLGPALGAPGSHILSMTSSKNWPCNKSEKERVHIPKVTEGLMRLETKWTISTLCYKC